MSHASIEPLSGSIGCVKYKIKMKYDSKRTEAFLAGGAKGFASDFDEWFELELASEGLTNADATDLNLTIIDPLLAFNCLADAE